MILIVLLMPFVINNHSEKSNSYETTIQTEVKLTNVQERLED